MELRESCVYWMFLFMRRLILGMSQEFATPNGVVDGVERWVTDLLRSLRHSNTPAKLKRWLARFRQFSGFWEFYNSTLNRRV